MTCYRERTITDANDAADFLKRVRKLEGDGTPKNLVQGIKAGDCHFQRDVTHSVREESEDNKGNDLRGKLRHNPMSKAVYRGGTFRVFSSTMTCSQSNRPMATGL
jgi:hypothetical protein